MIDWDLLWGLTLNNNFDHHHQHIIKLNQNLYSSSITWYDVFITNHSNTAYLWLVVHFVDFPMIFTICFFLLYFPHRHGFQMNDWRIHYWDNFWLIGSLGQGYLVIWPCLLSYLLLIAELWSMVLSGDHILDPVWVGVTITSLTVDQGRGPGSPGTLWSMMIPTNDSTFSRQWFSKWTFDRGKCVKLCTVSFASGQSMQYKWGCWNPW